MGVSVRMCVRVQARSTRSPKYSHGIRLDSPRATMYDTQILRADSLDLDQILPLILSFSNEVFQPETESKHTSLDVWKKRLSSPSSIILYVTHSGARTATEVSDVMAFLYAHPRTHTPPLRNGETETLHIWLAGVRPGRRRTGLLQMMVDKLLQNATGTLTICTIPPRFPDMWAWLTKRGWTVERDASEGRILLSKSAESSSQVEGEKPSTYCIFATKVHS